MNSSDVTLFVILAFAMAAVVLFSRKNIPQKLKRPLALFSLVMIVIAFALIVYSFFP